MYNSLSALPYIPYNILVYLARQDAAEDLWKLLKYNSYDALSKPNLTFDQKLELIWRNGPQEKFGVFFTPLVEDAICESKCVLKIYDYYIHAMYDIRIGDDPFLNNEYGLTEFEEGGYFTFTANNCYWTTMPIIYLHTLQHCFRLCGVNFEVKL